MMFKRYIKNIEEYVSSQAGGASNMGTPHLVMCNDKKNKFTHKKAALWAADSDKANKQRPRSRRWCQWLQIFLLK